LYDGIPFNPLKTWTEYLNRLSGVLVGIFATIMMLWSFRFWHTQRSWTRLAIGSWLLVGINGGIGAWVVSSRLAPVVISLHMVLAMLLIAVASRLYWVLKSEEKLDALSASSVRYYWLFVGVFLIQMVLGIELRQLMDLASHAGLARIEWLPSAGAMFWIHRSFSWVVLLSAWILLLKSPLSRRQFARGIFAMVILQMLTGMGLAYSGMLFAMQPLHLVLSAGAIVFVLGFKTTQEAEGKKR
jgi:heme a synthase